MKIKSETLLKDLESKTQLMIRQVEQFSALSTKELNTRPGKDKWSVLECIEHINLYGEFYLEEFEKHILNAKHKSSEFHKTGLMGNYSANSMLPKGDKTPMKMKTFKHMNPINSDLQVTVLDKFIKQQKHFLNLLSKAETVSLTKTKCALTIKGLKFRLGDTLRFYAFHNIRHINQASKVLGKSFDF